MNKQNGQAQDSRSQASLFPPPDPPPKAEAYKVRGSLKETSDSEAYFRTLDQLAEALTGLLQNDLPLPDELRQQLANPTLEALLFQEMNKILKLEKK